MWTWKQRAGKKSTPVTVGKYAFCAGLRYHGTHPTSCPLSQRDFAYIIKSNEKVLAQLNAGLSDGLCTSGLSIAKVTAAKTKWNQLHALQSSHFVDIFVDSSSSPSQKLYDCCVTWSECEGLAGTNRDFVLLSSYVAGTPMTSSVTSSWTDCFFSCDMKHNMPCCLPVF